MAKGDIWEGEVLLGEELGLHSPGRECKSWFCHSWL